MQIARPGSAPLLLTGSIFMFLALTAGNAYAVGWNPTSAMSHQQAETIPPKFVVSPCPDGGGSPLQVCLGRSISIDVEAIATNLTGTDREIVISATAYPAGGFFSPALPTLPSDPAMTQFSWTPTVSDLGLHSIVLTASYPFDSNMTYTSNYTFEIEVTADFPCDTFRRIFISEVVDATLPGGVPRYVELMNANPFDVDLSRFTIGNFNNGGTTLGGGGSVALPAIMLAAGDSYVLSYENLDSPGMSQFFTTYGFDADNLDMGAFTNGDDVIALFLADGLGPNGEANGDGADATLHDVYGELGVDGTGTLWEYTDSYARRLTSSASATFDTADWYIPGSNTLEGNCAGDDICEMALILALTDPGVHTCGTGDSPFTNSCFGDGGVSMGCTDCPCGNNAPMGSGGGCLNSSGTGNRLTVSGDTSVSLPSGDTTDLRFGAVGAPPVAFCILNSGAAVAPGNMANPCFGLGSGAQAVAFDGLRCAITNTRRHGGRSADVNGDIGVTNNPWGGEGGPPVGLAGAGGGFVAGQTRYFQIINRDDPLLGCTRGLNTSQAVEITFTP